MLVILLGINLLGAIIQVDTNDEVNRQIAIISPNNDPRYARPGLRYKLVEMRMSIGRMHALDSLKAMGSRAKPAVPILSKLIADPIEPTNFKLAEIEVLGELGAHAQASIPSLKTLLKSSDPKLREAARLALLKIELGIEVQKMATGTVSNAATWRDTDSAFEHQENEPVQSFRFRSGRGFNQARFSPCSRYVAAWSSTSMFSAIDSDLQIFELASGKECVSIDGRFRDFSFAPHGETVVVDRGDKMSVWRTGTGERLAQLDVGKSDSRRAFFRRNGQVFVTIDTHARVTKLKSAVAEISEQEIRLWNTQTWGELPHELDRFWSSSTFVSVDARIVAICRRTLEGHRQEIMIWDLETGKELAVPELDNPGSVFSMKNPDSLGITKGQDWYIWSLSKHILRKQPTRSPKVPDVPEGTRNTQYIRRLDWLENGVNVDLVDGNWEVTRISNGQKLNRFPNFTDWHEGPSENHKHVLNSQLMMLTSQTPYSGELCIWSVDEPSRSVKLTLEWPIEDVAIAPDDRTLAVLENRGNSKEIQQKPARVAVIDLEEVENQPAVLTQGNVLGVQAAGEDQLAVIFLNKIELWSWASRKRENLIRAKDDDTILAVEFLHDGQKIAIASGLSLELRDLVGGATRWRIDLGRPIDRIKGSPDGKYIAASTFYPTNEPQIWLLSAEDGSIIHHGKSESHVNLFHFWDQKEILAIIRQEDRVTQLDLASTTAIPVSQPERIENTNNLPVVDPFARWSANDFAGASNTGMYAVAGSIEGFSEQSGAVRIRDVLEGDLQTTLTAETGSMKCVSFFTDGRKLVAGGNSRIKHRIDLINLVEGEVVGVIEDQLGFLAQPSPTGDLLLTRHPIDGNKLSIWSTDNGTLLANFTVPGAPIFFTEFSADGKQLLITGGEIMVWDVEELIKNGQ